MMNEFVSDNVIWDAIPDNEPRGLHVTRFINLSARNWQALVARLRSGLTALAFLLAGVLIFVFVGFCAIVVVVDERCDPAIEYYGCQIPIEAGSLYVSPSAAVTGPKQ
jgi:hypothetical protein